MSQDVVVPLHGLVGPHSEDAQRMVELSCALSYGQAVELGALWEFDGNLSYQEDCEVIQEVLALTGRELPLGWFEAVFADCPWLTSTKALHAIADAVAATLVKDEVHHATFFSLVRPWWDFMSHNALHRVDLKQMKKICLT